MGWDFTNGTPKVSKLRARACLDPQVFSVRETWVLLEISWILGLEPPIELILSS